MSNLNTGLVERFFAPSISSTTYCENCGINPKYQNHDYCGKRCATEAETRRSSAAQTTSARGPPTSVARQGRLSSSTSADLCENCFWRTKSQEPDDDGTVITHPYCGIRCYQASQQTSWPASTIPAPAAAFAGHEPLALRMEHTNTPIGRKISVMMQERWKSNEPHIPKLKTIYRIDLPGQIYRRFDLALQMNDDCLVRTSYYGGRAVCSIADDSNPTPCTSESCGLCDALRSSFGNLLHGASCRDGDYGPGLYTYSNPAMAYHATVPGDDLQSQGSNFALIQCRVVAKADSIPSPNSYAGFIDDSGAVFCAQSTAIIPTHVLIFNAPVHPRARQHTIPVNANPVSLGSAPSTNTQGQHQPTTELALPGPLQSDTSQSQRQRDTASGVGSTGGGLVGNLSGVSLKSATSTPLWRRSRPESPVKATGALGRPQNSKHSAPSQSSRLQASSFAVFPSAPTNALGISENLDEPQKPLIVTDPKTNGGSEVLSNQDPLPIEYKKKKYPSGEHLYHAMKFIDTRPFLAEHIRECADPKGEAARFFFDRNPGWDQIRVQKMEEVIQLKCKQHSAFRDKLRDSGDTQIFFDDPDPFWGTGPDGSGENKFGEVLMKVRATLGKGRPIKRF